MQNENIESIPPKVKTNQLSYSEGAKQIWAYIYLEPYKYGLNKFTEDEKSDFLLSIAGSFEKVLRNFDASCSSFKTYLSHYLTNSAKNWRRKQAIESQNYWSVSTLEKNEYEIQQNNNTISDSFEKNKQNRQKIADCTQKKSKKKEIAEKTAVILFLRSYSFVTEKQLQQLFQRTSVKPDHFLAMLQNIQKKRQAQENRKEKLIAMRNKEFLLHLKYERLLALEDSEPWQQENVKKQYAVHTLRWKKCNKKLQSRSLHVASPELIAEELGESSRKVYFYINHALNKKKISWEQIAVENAPSTAIL